MSKSNTRKFTSSELFEAAVEINRLRNEIAAIDKNIMKLAMKRREAETLLSASTHAFAKMTGDETFGTIPANLVDIQPDPDMKKENKIGFLQ